MNPIYGQMAQTVAPNSKCESCLHYDSNRGRNGVCEIGLRPIVCGDGDMPSIGYAPVHAIGPDAVGPHAPVGQAPIQPAQLIPASALYHRDGVTNGPIPMAIVTLGEEHAEMVKSFHEQFTQRCTIHKASRSVPAAAVMNSWHASGYRCECREPKTYEIVHALTKSFNNREKFQLGSGEHTEFVVEQFVRGVRKGLSIQDIRKSLTEACVEKGYYADDWLTQFKGTDMFDDAVKLCEEELALQEKQLERNIERVKKDRARHAAIAKLNVAERDEPDHWQEENNERRRIDLAKQKLQLKLAKHQQKKMGK